MTKIYPLIAIILTMLMAGGCASKPVAPRDRPSIIQAFKTTSIPTSVNAMRATAIENAAMSLGAQGGLAWRSQQLNKLLNSDQHQLDRIFNFRALLLNNNVLPPVLSEGRDALNLDGPDALRIADRVYKIESPPRFVTAPPNWRDYLWMNYKQPDKPDSSLLPKNDDERIIWNQYITIGWQDGVQQADQIFSANLGRLKRDFQGMILYRILLAQNMVTSPFVARADLGVTGDANQIRINDQVLRITATSQLQPNSKVWKPALIPDNYSQ